ncbi:MAG: DUF2920 family protein, partial [bacterium]
DKHYGRTIDCTYTLPDNGCNAETGLLVLLPNFGQNISEEVRLRDYLADNYNLIVIQCDYFGKEFMEEKKYCLKSDNWEAVKKIFTESELDLIQEGEYLNVVKMMDLGSKKKEKATLSLREDLNEESIDNCNDLSIMQALDHISSVLAVKETMKKEGIIFNGRKIIFCGAGLGGYLAYLANALAPHLISCIIDFGGWIKPVYLSGGGRYLQVSCGEMNVNRRYVYLAENFYDKQLTDLIYLYKNFTNEASIFSYYPQKGDFRMRHEKELFCQMINADFKLSATEDFLSLCKDVLGKTDFNKLSFTSKECCDLFYKTDQAIYAVEYHAGRPFITVIKRKYYCEIRSIRRLLFKGKLDACREKIFAFLKDNDQAINNLSSEKKVLMGEILQNLFFALQDCDYLLALDLLKFEVLPLLEEGINNCS